MISTFVTVVFRHDLLDHHLQQSASKSFTARYFCMSPPQKRPRPQDGSDNAPSDCKRPTPSPDNSSSGPSAAQSSSEPATVEAGPGPTSSAAVFQEASKCHEPAHTAILEELMKLYTLSTGIKKDLSYEPDERTTADLLMIILQELDDIHCIVKRMSKMAKDSDPELELVEGRPDLDEFLYYEGAVIRW
ncbi:hypothetical protein PSEUBRA_001280 [Kalmanozyma brasiliensis GHG001]|uniref:uncharacterized protein n=1 Tax=Kalmanozyma brasiliensis (strain GHG001) TaxID=1365824 RepID=UPI002867CD57|nr:uncharacterized protein PSEUBRA_001280 [Kalmanozyma brasiliensis GHG001]KAF6766916.1 hypothetical protein PSEUBRA_001280 [Kalmanozyma brasiliensis GHG001]